MIEILEHLSKSNLLAWNRAPYPPKYAGTYKIAAYNTVVEWQHWIVRRARAGDFMVFAARKGSRVRSSRSASLQKADLSCFKKRVATTTRSC